MELYDEILNINLKGSFLASRSAIPALIDRGGGSIIMIGSVAGIRDSSTTHSARPAAGNSRLVEGCCAEYRATGLLRVLGALIGRQRSLQFGDGGPDLVRDRLESADVEAVDLCGTGCEEIVEVPLGKVRQGGTQGLDAERGRPF